MEQGAQFRFGWRCPSDLSESTCSTFGEVLKMTPYQRLVEFQLWFDMEHYFLVTAENVNAQYFKSSSNSVSLKFESPEVSGVKVSSCLKFQLSPRQSDGVKMLTWREEGSNSKNMDQRISFDNKNVTTSAFMFPPVVDYNSCLSGIKTGIEKGTFKFRVATYPTDNNIFEAYKNRMLV